MEEGKNNTSWQHDLLKAVRETVTAVALANEPPPASTLRVGVVASAPASPDAMANCAKSMIESVSAFTSTICAKLNTIGDKLDHLGERVDVVEQTQNHLTLQLAVIAKKVNAAVLQTGLWPV